MPGVIKYFRKRRKSFAAAANDPYLPYTVLKLQMSELSQDWSAFYSGSQGGPGTMTATNALIGTAAGYWNGQFSQAWGGCDLPGDFTIEMWVNPTQWNCALFTTGFANSVMDWQCGAFSVGLNSSGQPYVFQNDSTGFTYTCTSITAPKNTWTHLAWQRQNGRLRIFVNGYNYYISGASSGTSVVFGGTGGTNKRWGLSGTNYQTTADRFYGYLTGFRVTKNAVRYLATTTTTTVQMFIPSTQVFPTVEAPPSVRFLSHMEDLNSVSIGTGPWSVDGTLGVTVSTTRKFGTGAFYMNKGAGNYVKANMAGDTDIGLQDFTMECWWSPTANRTGSTQLISIFSNLDGAQGPRLAISQASATNITIKLQPAAPSDYASPTLTVVQNAWYHLAAVRHANAVFLFLNGVKVHTANQDQGLSWNSLPGVLTRDLRVVIGNLGGLGSGYPLMDDARVTVGKALYITNFTPPTAAFPDTY